ncbi:MAG: DUF427 domain-containing protein [Rhodospirillales bacterium]|nr:DUF427 domain-containing protein [Rhodospirillales bacterium]
MNFQPSPSDAISVSFSREPVTVRLGDTVLVESDAAVILHEPGYPDRYYFPRLDVKMNFLKPSDKSTVCPHKGKAEYFDIEIKGSHRSNLAWSYPAAKLNVAEISGYIAFYDDPEISIS